MAGVSQTPRKCCWHRPGIAPKAQGHRPEGTVPLTQLEGARQNHPALSLCFSSGASLFSERMEVS